MSAPAVVWCDVVPVLHIESLHHCPLFPRIRKVPSLRCSVPPECVCASERYSPAFSASRSCSTKTVPMAMADATLSLRLRARTVSWDQKDQMPGEEADEEARGAAAATI